MQPSAPALEWGFPFLGMLASIVLFPMLAPRFPHPPIGSAPSPAASSIARSGVLPANASGALKPLGNPPRSAGLMPPAPWDSLMGIHE